MKVWVDRTLCENHGQCAIAAPNTFEMDEEGILQYTEGLPAGELEYIEDAINEVLRTLAETLLIFAARAHHVRKVIRPALMQRLWRMLAAQALEGREHVWVFKPERKPDELLPLTVKSAFFQTFLDATTSEHVARMVAMKSATDNADKMGKALQLRYNRARQSQITTELSEIMGGVEAMNV